MGRWGVVVIIWKTLFLELMRTLLSTFICLISLRIIVTWFTWHISSQFRLCLFVYVLQTASSSIFGIGSQQTKCVRHYTTQEILVTPATNLLKLVRLVWIDNRTVVLLTTNGSETKYSVWIKIVYMYEYRSWCLRSFNS